MSIELKIPEGGESITEVEIGNWLKQAGDRVEKDEPIVALESEKATVELPAPEAGTITKVLRKKGDVAKVGEVIAYLEPDGKAGTKTGPSKKPAEEKRSAPPKAEQHEASRVMPAAKRALGEQGLKAEEVHATGPGGRLLKEDVLRQVEQRSEPMTAPVSSAQAKSSRADSAEAASTREEEVVPMSRLRRTVAERLVEAQRNAALLTTFNEIDMSSVMELRKEHGEAFQQKYKVKLGFMSFFVKASIDALKLFPVVNAEVRGTNIVYHNHFDIGIAVSTERGLVVPVLRNAERLSFAEVEIAIGDFAARSRENKLKVEELQGGTFTITNGGIFGSLLSTPIINPPQSGILGMHAIQERPVAHQGAVVIRPMMYVALTYDHRIVDGREAVSFLKRVKDAIENPARMLIEA
jgi:2-oxoglutarate dehydrogenase E2 component (dihydrolipoamide succinyltransferase)